MTGDGPAQIRREVQLLLTRAGHWGPARWLMPASGGQGATRADLVYALVQRLADRAADAEGVPRRRVPRLDNDLALLDQVRVLVADLTASGAGPTASGAGPTALDAAAADLASVRQAL